MSGFVEKRRVVVQISCGGVTHVDGIEAEYLYALCDDGSVWWINTEEPRFRMAWQRVPEIPQGDED